MDSSKPSFVFFGTPHFAALALDEFLAANLLPELIVTAPDKPAGRGLESTPPAVKTWAIAHNIPYIQPVTLKEIPAELVGKKYDVFVVAAYGKILRPKVLDLPLKGCMNLHPSMLPKYRGASPIESQILADEPHVGVSIIVLDEEMDHGPIVAAREVSIPDWPIAKHPLTTLLAKESGALAAEILPDFVAGNITPTPQDHARATYTEKIEKSDGLLNLTDTARGNYLKCLAYEGWPSTFFFAFKGERQVRVKITAASFVDDQFIIERVVPEGKSEQSFAEFSKHYVLTN